MKSSVKLLALVSNIKHNPHPIVVIFEFVEYETDSYRVD